MSKSKPTGRRFRDFDPARDREEDRYSWSPKLVEVKSHLRDPLSGESKQNLEYLVAPYAEALFYDDRLV